MTISFYRSVVVSALGFSTALLAHSQPAIIKNSNDATPESNLRLTPIVEGLEHPWGIAWLPDGSMLITERPGRVRLVKKGKLVPQPIGGVPEVFAQGQGGLLDISLHPDFKENQLVYFTYTAGTAQLNHTRVGRAKFDGKLLSNWQVILAVAPKKSDAQHFGSRLVWLPDRTLLVSIGDGGNPPLRLGGSLIREQAQNRKSQLGKVLRIQGDGKIPIDNPFANNPDTDRALWSYGHRNIQGLAIDPQTKTIWATEHGARGGDELNQLEPGKNYGWPKVSYSRDYVTGLPISLAKSRSGLVDPLVVWQNAIAPSGLVVYRGRRFPQWNGNLFVGGLVSQNVQRINVEGKALGVIPIGSRVRDVRQGPDDFLYVLTDESQGKLLRIEKL